MAIVVLATIGILSLAGCSNDNAINVDSIPETEDLISNDTVENTKPSNEDKLYSDFATDNAGGNGYKAYDSGIYTESTELAEPYSYSGITYDQAAFDQDINNENLVVIADKPLVDRPLVDSGNLDNVESAGNIDESYSNSIDNTILNIKTQLDELKSYEYSIDEAEEIRNRVENLGAQLAELESTRNKDGIQDSSIQDTDASQVGSQANDELDKINTIKNILFSIYDNGIILLRGEYKASEYDDSGYIAELSIINNVRASLESIEQCDTLVKDLGNKQLENDWNSVKKELCGIRLKLSTIDSKDIKGAKSVVNSNNEVDGYMYEFYKHLKTIA